MLVQSRLPRSGLPGLMSRCLLDILTRFTTHQITSPPASIDRADGCGQPLAVASTANKDWNRTVDLLRTAGAISFEGYAWYRLVRYSRSLVDLPSDLTPAKSPNEPTKKYSSIGENQQSFFNRTT